jgi:hypothetical protein
MSNNPLLFTIRALTLVFARDYREGGNKKKSKTEGSPLYPLQGLKLIATSFKVEWNMPKKTKAVIAVEAIVNNNNHLTW